MSAFNFSRKPQQTVPLTSSERDTLEQKLSGGNYLPGLRQLSEGYTINEMGINANLPVNFGPLVTSLAIAAPAMFFEAAASVSYAINPPGSVNQGFMSMTDKAAILSIVPAALSAIMVPIRRHQVAKIDNVLESGQRPLGRFFGLEKVAEVRRNSIA